MPMMTADQALEIVLENVAPLGVERTPILDALGRVLAEEIRSPRDIPGFDNSAMDGYAVRAADIIDAPPSRAFIRPRGEDLRKGEVVISADKMLSAADLGMLASVNRAMVEVIRRPRVAIVSTGDELVDVDEAPTGAQIVNSSAYALAGATREAGGEPTILKVA